MLQNWKMKKTIFIFQKYGKFKNIFFFDNFIKHKTFISEEWVTDTSEKLFFFIYNRLEK